MSNKDFQVKHIWDLLQTEFTAELKQMFPAVSEVLEIGFKQLMICLSSLLPFQDTQISHTTGERIWCFESQKGIKGETKFLKGVNKWK